MCVSCSPENCSFKIALSEIQSCPSGKIERPVWYVMYHYLLVYSMGATTLSTNQWENESVWLFCWDMFRRVSTPLKNIGQLGLLFPIYGNILCPHLQRKIHPSIPGNAPKKTPHRPFTQLAHNFLIKFGLLMVKSSVCVVKLHVQHD